MLGINGAGKTTTIEVFWINLNYSFINYKILKISKILTGEQHATSGSTYINGYNIETDRLKAIKSLGFCPQFEYLPEFLTVEESLELFANLRGLETHKIRNVVNEFMNAFKLNEFKNKLVQTLR